MRLPGRLGLAGVVALLWLAVVCLALELCAALRLRTIAGAGDTFPGQAEWAPPAVTTPLHEDGAGASRDTYREDEDHLGSRFAVLSEEDRAWFARLREEWIAVYGPDGQDLAVYGEAGLSPRFGFALERLQGAVIAEGLPATLGRVFESGEPDGFTFDVGTPSGAQVIEASCFPMGTAGGTVDAVVCSFRNVTHLPLAERLARVQPPGDPLWRVPWFEYRKHVRITDNYVINNVGFRDDDVALPKPPGVFRIVCVGGSTTVEGMDNRSTYPNVLERLLQDHFGTDAIEVVNAGVNGLGSLGERKRALDYVLLEPDLVIHYNFVNDACHGLFQLWEKQAAGWQKLLRRSRFASLYGNAWLLPARRDMGEQLERSTFANLRLFRECLAAKDVEVAFCSFACPHYATLWARERDFYECVLKRDWQGRFVTLRSYCGLVGLYNEKLRAFCAEVGAQYLEVAENLEGGADYFVDICHLRPKGIERKAEILFEQVRPYVVARFPVRTSP